MRLTARPPIRPSPRADGGPGCSSLSGGLFSEFGPFRPNADGSLTLTPNPWTWTLHASIIFLEQPAGVGFSWSADTSDYTTGDFQSAQDAYQFLLGFTARFPRYAGREIYISGESYGGHYVSPSKPSPAAPLTSSPLP